MEISSVNTVKSLEIAIKVISFSPLVELKEKLIKET